MSNPIHVTDANFDAEVLKSDLVVITDFWAEWSRPCKQIAPYLEAIAQEYNNKVKVAKLDIDANPNATATYNVLNMPTLIVFKNGQPVERLVGTIAKNKIEKTIKPYLPK